MFKICIYSLFTTKGLGYQVFDLCNAPSGAIWIWPPPFVNLIHFFLVPDVVISRENNDFGRVFCLFVFHTCKHA